VKRIVQSGMTRFIAFGVAAVAVLGTLYVLLRPPPAQTAVPTSGHVTQTRWGPLDGNDRLMLTKVRQVNLWETPTTQQAQQRAASPKIRQVAGFMMEQHMTLDTAVRDVAAKLGVVLPSTPNANQQKWMALLSTKTGADYDRYWVNLLRAAHGQVLIFVAQVRANTRNDLIRSFAQLTLTTVLRHVNYLESTGLVTFQPTP
jgi:predicted outer membrane protein